MTSSHDDAGGPCNRPPVWAGARRVSASRVGPTCSGSRPSARPEGPRGCCRCVLQALPAGSRGACSRIGYRTSGAVQVDPQAPAMANNPAAESLTSALPESCIVCGYPRQRVGKWTARCGRCGSWAAASRWEATRWRRTRASRDMRACVVRTFGRFSTGSRACGHCKLPTCSTSAQHTAGSSTRRAAPGRSRAGSSPTSAWLLVQWGRYGSQVSRGRLAGGAFRHHHLQRRAGAYSRCAGGS